MINGSEVHLPRGKPSLAAGAVPTLLPDCPSYLSIRSIKQRPERKRPATACVSSISKKPRPGAQNESAAVAEEELRHPLQDVYISELNAQNEAAGPIEREPFTVRMLQEVKLPSKLWCRLNCDSDASVLFATTSMRRDMKLEIFHDKSVLFCAHEDKVSAQMFICGVLCGDFTIRSLAMANRVLLEADASTTCNGAMTRMEFSDMSRIMTPKLRSATTIFGGNAFSTKCLGKVSKQGNLFIATFIGFHSFHSILHVYHTCAPLFFFFFFQVLLVQSASPHASSA